MKRSELPSIFYRLFKWFCKPELFEELQGDLEEAFEENKSTLGAPKARAIYRKEVLKMIRPSVTRGFVSHRFNHLVLFKNYFKTAYRGMIKSPLSSFINVFGLAVAIGMCVVVYAFYEFDYSLDRFHEHKDEVFLTTFYVDRDGTEEQYGTTPSPLATMLKEDFVQVEKVCRVEDRPVVMKFEDNVFHETVRYVDPEFLEMFTFPLKWGVKSSLSDLNNIILSQSISEKYFGEQNPLGQTIRMITGEGQGKNFQVTGVAVEFPREHIIAFDFLINFENFRSLEPDYDFNDWSRFVNATLVQVRDSSDIEFVKAGMEKYRDLQNEVQNDWAITSFSFEQLATLHFASANIRNGISYDYNAEARLGLPIIAAFMLVLSCLNYLNIAIVSATKRLKEIGLRKVIGANRRIVAVQFLAENVFMTSFALVLGMVLAILLFIPWFSQLSGDPLELDLIDPNLWIFLIAVVIGTGIISGIYPAFYISRFQAVKIFKGSVRFGKKNVMTKLFLGLQMIMTCAGITVAVMFTQNNTFQNNRSWGYNNRETLFVEVPDYSGYQALSNELIKDPDVLSVSGSAHHLGESHATSVIQMPDRKYEVDHLEVDGNYFGTMEVPLLEGRYFRSNLEADREAVIVNEQLVKNLSLYNPIGQSFKIDSSKYQIVGVIKDFHLKNFYHELRPLIFTVAQEEEYGYLSYRVRPGSEKESYSLLQEKWSVLFPEIPFQGNHQKDTWSGFFQQLNKAEEFYKVLAVIAVMLASLGLYGLVTLNVAGRVKEFSIRKILGAGARNLTSNVMNEYATLFSLALIVGIPFSYITAKASMEMLYAYPMPVTFSGMIVALTILIFVLIGVVFSQVRSVLAASPVKGLRTE